MLSRLSSVLRLPCLRVFARPIGLTIIYTRALLNFERRKCFSLDRKCIEAALPRASIDRRRVDPFRIFIARDATAIEIYAPPLLRRGRPGYIVNYESRLPGERPDLSASS